MRTIEGGPRFQLPANPYRRQSDLPGIIRGPLNHVIVLNERHLCRILGGYFGCYHSCRTHLSLSKDSPKPRTVQPPDLGKVTAFPFMGGLIITTDDWRHRYFIRESPRMGLDAIFRVDKEYRLFGEFADNR